MKNYQHNSKSGFSLVEVIIVAAISVVVFGALFASFKYSLELMTHSRAKLSALAVANDRMEYFRSLPYDDVGTLSGIPSGTIPQNSVITLNDIDFNERVLVDYVDDPADGEGGLDSNAIVSDYKRIKVEYTWTLYGVTKSISLISNIVPPSIETTVGGGTIRVNVIGPDSILLPGASVRLVNNTIIPNIDVTRTTDASGAALFSGAPAGSDYEVTVTANIGGNQYSTDQTYWAGPTIANPLVAPFAVLEADVSTLTFQIGDLSDLSIKVLSAFTENSFKEDFTDLTAVASSTNVSVNGGKLVLEDTLGVYDSSGIVYLGPITPATLVGWQTLRIAADIPVNTSHSVKFYTGDNINPFVLIPDTDLDGNGAGFTDNIIDISELDTTSYPSIYVGISLGTTDTSVTPEVDEMSVFYRESETARSSLDLDIEGNKIVGTSAALEPIYKYSNSLTTDGSGELGISDLEFDTYTFSTASGLDIASACPAHPFNHQAGIDGNLELVMVSNSSDTLRVIVVDSLGRSLPGAEVNLTRSGYDVTHSTDSCGQVFFTGGVSANTDYTIDVTATGYNDNNVPVFEINGDTVTTITMTE
jgi:type II secretory pathway pseudopilin PulG